MKSVLITGANRGLGFAMAESFYQKGYRVYTVVRNDEAKAIIHQHFPESFVLIADVTDTDYQTRLQEFLADKKLDVVINNAGSGGNRGVRTDLCTPEHLMTEFSSHCVGALSTVQGTLASLKHAEHPVVVNISSRRGSLHMQSQGEAKQIRIALSYRIAKAAQNMLSLCMADDLETDGIKVIVIHPGALLTDMAPPDADLTPKESAKRLLNLLESNAFSSREFISLATRDRLPW